MIKSMTGYGKKELLFSDKKVILEIRSLNSKSSDINIKLPYVYKEKEMEVRQLVLEELNRGKIDLNIFIEQNEGNVSNSINKDVVKSYYLQLKQLQNDLNLHEDKNLLEIIMPLPDTLKAERSVLNESEWDEIRHALYLTIKEVDQFRTKEGKVLKEDINFRIRNISELLANVKDYESQRLNNIKEKLLSELKELSADIEFDKNRLEQELLYYLEKLDISEEKTRLSHHLEYFSETIKHDKMPGKKLGFIAQEIGREINTIGSKANNFSIQKIVVQMKDELEKIREQLLNVL